MSIFNLVGRNAFDCNFPCGPSLYTVSEYIDLVVNTIEDTFCTTVLREQQDYAQAFVRWVLRKIIEQILGRPHIHVEQLILAHLQWVRPTCNNEPDHFYKDLKIFPERYEPLWAWRQRVVHMHHSCLSIICIPVFINKKDAAKREQIIKYFFSLPWQKRQRYQRHWEQMYPKGLWVF